MKTYAELLRDPQWLQKRKKILKRDKNSCRECNNKNLISNAKLDFAIFGDKLDDKMTFILTASPVDKIGFTPLLDNIKADSSVFDIIYFEKDNKNKYIDIIALAQNDFSHRYQKYEMEVAKLKLKKTILELLNKAKNNNNLAQAQANLKKDVYLRKLIKELGDENYPNKLEATEKQLTLLKTNNPLDSIDWEKWNYIAGLHVHHTYYREPRINPWEYPDDALITLCWVCHEKTHKDNITPILNKDDINIGNFHNCKRCHGAGVFPEYRHVSHGICFRCGGKCFEELINSD